jgi:hypothetical protein
MQKVKTQKSQSNEGNKRSGENSLLGRERILQLLSMHRKAGHLFNTNIHMCTIAKCECSEVVVPCMRSVQLPLANRCDLTGTSQPTLGVLFFPLSPPSHKGATHTIPENASTQLASQGRATTRYPSWVSQLPQEKVQSR